MIEQETVLILGAGASADYGFPLGKKLIEEIYIFIKKDNTDRIKKALALLLWINDNPKGISVSLEKIKPYLEKVNIFIEALELASVSSIDDFLHHRKELALIGKLVITFIISDYEKPHVFKPKYPSEKFEFPDGWYSYLWQSLYSNPFGDANLENLAKNKLKIITFNYDRSLEHFLFHATKSLFNESDDKTVDFINKISIDHVYGKLGALDWQKETEYPINNYGDVSITGDAGPLGVITQLNRLNEISHVSMPERQIAKLKRILSIAKSINTYTEIISSEKTNSYKKTIMAADRVYFLGFGYHQQNLNALGLNDSKIISKKNKYGTTFSLGRKEAIDIYNKLQINYPVYSDGKPPDYSWLNSLKIEKYFREVLQL